MLPNFLIKNVDFGDFQTCLFLPLQLNWFIDGYLYLCIHSWVHELRLRGARFSKGLSPLDINQPKCIEKIKKILVKVVKNLLKEEKVQTGIEKNATTLVAE